MVDDSRIEDFIANKQAGIINDGAAELQKELKELAGEADMPYATLLAYRNLTNKLTLVAVKRLLRVKGMAQFISRLFAPEGYVLVTVEQADKIDHYEKAEAMQDFLSAKHAAHHPESEAGPAIGPGEDACLRQKFAIVVGGRQ